MAQVLNKTRKANPDVSVWDYMNSKGKEGNYATRKKLFDAHFNGTYTGTAQQNLQLIADLKAGKISLDAAPAVKTSANATANPSTTKEVVKTTAPKVATSVPRGTTVVNKPNPLGVSTKNYTVGDNNKSSNVPAPGIQPVPRLGATNSVRNAMALPPYSLKTRTYTPPPPVINEDLQDKIFKAPPVKRLPTEVKKLIKKAIVVNKEENAQDKAFKKPAVKKIAVKKFEPNLTITKQGLRYY